MVHKVYPKIKRLGAPETEGILNGTCVIQEKIDGANLSIWFEGDELMIGSRRQVLSEAQEESGQFAPVREYIMNHKGILSLFGELMEERDTKDIRLFGEWLVPHTITDYNPEAYNKFYLFDIEVDGLMIGPSVTNVHAVMHKIEHPQIFDSIENPAKEQIDEFVGMSSLGAKAGEGVVVRNYGFVNKFGDSQIAKVVSEKFKEENMITFGGCQSGDTEMRIILKYCTEGRVRKIIQKIQINEGRDIGMDDIKRIIGMTYYDVTTEELKYIMKQGVVDFRRLAKLMGGRTAKIAIGIITGEPTSVAFNDSLSSCETAKEESQ